MRNQVIADLPEADYFADPALSQSALKIIGDLSPAHFRCYKDGEIEDEESSALLIGTAFDKKATDPAEFARIIEVRPAEHTSYRTKAAKTWRTAVKAEGKLPITPRDAADLSKMLGAVQRNPIARELMGPGDSQVSVFAPLCGVECKGRIDRVPAKFLTPFGKGLADIKTARSAHPKEWGKAVFEHGYHIQAAFYLDLWKEAQPQDARERFFFLVAEKTAPFPCAVYELPGEIIELGRQTYKRLLGIYAKCVRDNHWPSYGDGGVAQPIFTEWMLRDMGLDRSGPKKAEEFARERGTPLPLTLDAILK